MAWANEEIAGLLREYAELTQITGGDVFRARNYEKAARSVRGWADDISQLDPKALRAIPGVGASIAAKIAEYRETGSIGAATNQLIVSRTEEEVYARLGLAWVPPAMREDRGEIEAAAQGQMPGLVRENDLKGDLHTHTDLTDGVASLETMVAAAQRGDTSTTPSPTTRRT